MGQELVPEGERRIDTLLGADRVDALRRDLQVVVRATAGR